MATYRNIQMSFWTDSKILSEFSPEEKLMYLYLMTNPHTNLCGCYEIDPKLIAFETGFSDDTAKDLLKRLSEHGVIEYSEETREILIVKWYKYNWTSSEKLRKALEFSISKIIYEPFKKYLIDMFNGIYTIWDKSKYGMDTVSIGYGYNGNGNGNVSFRLGNVSDSLGNSLGNGNVSDSKEKDPYKLQYKDPETGRIRFNVEQARKDRGI